ncbi:MAG: acetyl-CoA carboxylase biotin carboxylase subunit, partial [Myxococcota bacterium]
YSQADLSARGHAIECRVYAEDPAMGFMPSPGVIDVLRTPAGPGVRDDSGAYEGVEITPNYDPLVSKLSVWAPTRAAAIDRMRRALLEYVVGGIKTNLPFHIRLMDHPDFVEGKYDTGFIAAHEDALLRGALPQHDALLVAAALVKHLEGGQPAAATAASAAPISAWRLAARTRL